MGNILIKKMTSQVSIVSREFTISVIISFCRFSLSFVDDLYRPNHLRLNPLYVFLLVIGKPTHAPRVSHNEQDNSKTNTHEVIESSHINLFSFSYSVKYSNACIAFPLFIYEARMTHSTTTTTFRRLSL